MALLPTARRGGGGSREGRSPRETDWPLRISLKEIARPGPVTQPSRGMLALPAKVEVNRFSFLVQPFSHHHLPNHQSHQYWQHRLPKKEGLSYGSHSETAKPPQSLAVAASSWQHLARIPSLNGEKGQKPETGYIQARRRVKLRATTQYPLSLVAQLSQVVPNPSGHQATPSRGYNLSTDTHHSSRYCILGAKRSALMALTVPTSACVF